MNGKSATERFLALARLENIEKFKDWIEEAETGDWRQAQLAFLQLTDDYLEHELAKPASDNVQEHEAGGQWRIAFPHYESRGDPRLLKRFAETQIARKSWTDKHYIHGFPDCAEIHHEVETFLFFQIPLCYSGYAGASPVKESILDVAHHVVNRLADVPAWYDWQKHGFVSVWLGTRGNLPFVFWLARPGCGEEKNLVRNSGFEETGLSGWEVLNKDAAAWVLDTADRHTGKKSLKLDFNPGPAGAAETFSIRQVFAPSGSGDYKLEAFVRLSADFNGTLKIILTFTASGKPVRMILPFKGRGGEWIKMTEIFSLPENVTDLAVQIEAKAKSGSVWVDDVFVANTKIEYLLIE
jgi:hypothetical protein